MISLRQHNDIVEKLMKQLSARQNEIKALNKDKIKTPQQIPQIQQTFSETQLSKKITQLNKQHKQRISTLTQQLRNKSLENKDLKERLLLKKNQECKQKEHISEIMKKNFDRKASTPNDYKVSALISHYEGQVAKKVKVIQGLQRQLKIYDQQSGTRCSKENNDEQIQNKDLDQNNEIDRKSTILIQYQCQINKIKTQNQKYRRLFEQKEKQYKDLSRRYSQLTNQYYRVLNAYGIEDSAERRDQKQQKGTRNNNSNMFAKTKKIQNNKPLERQNALQNLLWEMAATDSQLDQSNLSSSFQANLKRIGSQPQINFGNKIENKQLTSLAYSDSTQQDTEKNTFKIEQIMQNLGVENTNQIVPYLANMKAKIGQFQICDNIARSLQSFLYRFGMGKLSKSRLLEALQQLQMRLNKNLEASDLLDQICIQVGAKKHCVREKILELKISHQQYFKSLKSVQTVQKMSKSSKVLEFIEYFQLDQNDEGLPEQLTQIYQQLKMLNKFVKEIKAILEIGEGKDTQMVLELVLKYIQKTSNLMAQIQRKKYKNKHDDS